jgi:hypothetical protein
MVSEMELLSSVMLLVPSEVAKMEKNDRSKRSLINSSLSFNGFNGVMAGLTQLLENMLHIKL